MRTRLVGVLATLATVSVLAATGGPVQAGATQASVVSDVPVATTPNVTDGSVQAVVQIGSRIVIGGNFTSASPPGLDAPLIARPNILAFDATTGDIDPTFVPALNGPVNALRAGPTPTTVYVGGDFTTVDGAAQRGVALLNLLDGKRVTSFVPPVLAGGTVNALALAGTRLLVAGNFTTAGGLPRGGLASIDAASGALDSYLTLSVAGHHSYPVGLGVSAPVGVTAMAVSPDRTHLVAVGNFKTVNGVARDQIVKVDLGSAAATLDLGWATLRYTPACSYWLHDSYVRDVDFSPDGSYFVVVSTGGPHLGTLCDAAARWETAVTSTVAEPTWVDSTGGDSLLSVAVTGTAVYVGGHQRWLNNTYGNNTAGPGAVPRPGVAALDPVNGLPLSWNPGRDPRGVGTRALVATADGVWMGSDTGHIGVPGDPTFRRRIAFFPLAGGAPPRSTSPAGLPGTVFLAAPAGAPLTVTTQRLDGSLNPTTSPSPAPDGGMGWSTVRGAVMIGSRLYYGRSDGRFYDRTFDGTTYGPEAVLDPYHDPKWATVPDGSGGFYLGASPAFVSEIPALTSLFFAGGRLYYTVSGRSPLYFRAFTPDSGIVGATEFQSAGGISWADAQGAFVAGSQLYYASRTTGALSRVRFTAGAPVPGTSTLVDARPNWRAGATFLFSDPGTRANTPPRAGLSARCVRLACTVSAAASTDVDGSIATVGWDFGDRTKAIGLTPPTHVYTATGVHLVTVTVTDNDGAVDTARRSLPTGPAADFDGNGRSDLAVFRPGTGTWWVRGSVPVPFGRNGDVPVAADYNGDGRTDIAVFRPANGTWYVRGAAGVPFGRAGDLPVVGDFTGDGIADLTVFRPSNGTWYTRGRPAVGFGRIGDIPLTGDYTGDGRADIAVFRPADGTWYVRGGPGVQFGRSGDIPVAGDFDADGVTDIALFRPSVSTWYVRGVLSLGFGAPTDVPVALDFDGDGRTEITVWRPANGVWYQREAAATAWGQPGDRPIQP